MTSRSTIKREHNEIFPERHRRRESYLTAFLIGLGLVLWVFPRWALTGGLPPGAPPRADFGKDVLGQLYFFSQPWSLGTPASFLIDRDLNQPGGASIALTDSMPLLTVLAKLLKPLLPPFDQTVSIYQAAAWIMQPVAAVFALRSAEERRWLPALAVGLMAASMPVFLFRLWQSALSGHFPLLLMLGLYLRVIRGSTAALTCGCLLQIALLLIHPYLMLMASALLLAAPLTLLLNGSSRWRSALSSVAASSCAVMLLGQELGYWGSDSDGGFGYYSMNLAAPFWPTYSGLFPAVPFGPVDATGGQAEGYAYLGLGMLSSLAVSSVGWRSWLAGVRRHAGLALACAALLTLAVTNWVFVMQHRVVHIPFPSPLLSQVRASGRCFWPITYVLVIMSLLVIMRTFPRTGGVIAVAASLVQFVDAGALRSIDRSSLTDPTPYPFDQPRLSAILRGRTRLTMLPTFPCNGGGTVVNVDPLWLAGQSRMKTNSMYMARETRGSRCIPEAVLQTRPEPDEVRIVLPGSEQAVAVLPNYADDCRTLTPYVICTRDAASLDGLPHRIVRPVPTSIVLPVRSGLPGADMLMAGWTQPSSREGAWSEGTAVVLGARIEPVPSGAVRIRLRARAMPSRPSLGTSAKARSVSVWAGARHIADWSMDTSMSDYEAVVPAEEIRNRGALVLELRTGPLTSLLDLGISTGPRRFGIWLDAASLSRVD